MRKDPSNAAILELLPWPECLLDGRISARTGRQGPASPLSYLLCQLHNNEARAGGDVPNRGQRTNVRDHVGAPPVVLFRPAIQRYPGASCITAPRRFLPASALDLPATCAPSRVQRRIFFGACASGRTVACNYLCACGSCRLSALYPPRFLRDGQSAHAAPHAALCVTPLAESPWCNAHSFLRAVSMHSSLTDRIACSHRILKSEEGDENPGEPE